MLIGVSHQPWTIPAELFGDGGFERMAFVSPPDWDARRFRIWESSWGSARPSADLDRLVIATEGWSGPDITRLGELSRDARMPLFTQGGQRPGKFRPARFEAVKLGEFLQVLKKKDI